MGEQLPTRSWSGDLEPWNRYAAVNDEFVDIHMDHAAGRTAGFSGAIGMGNLLWSYLHVVLRDWLPPGGQLLELSCRFGGPSLAGGVVIVSGEVVAVADQDAFLTLQVADGDGQVLVPARARVRLT